MTFSQAITYFLVSVTCTVIATIILRRTSYEMGRELEINSFKYMIGCYLVFVTSNVICLLANYIKDSNIGYIFTFANLTSLCACAFFWFRFIEAMLDISHSRFLSRLNMLPLIIVIMLISTSIFTRLMFYYTDEGEHARGPLYILLAVVPAFYILYAAIQIIRRIARTDSPSKRKELNFLLSFLLLPMIAGALEMIVPHLPVMELAVLVNLVLFYVHFQDRLIYVDSLTGMDNRRVADQYFRTNLDLASPGNPLYFFLADCDDFKEINDVYGHLEGDRALKIIGSELEKLALTYSCRVARWGGDEFVLIARSTGIPEPEALIQIISDNLSERIKEEDLPYDMPISIGYVACYDSSENPADIFMEAERQMYRAKENNKLSRQSAER